MDVAWAEEFIEGKKNPKNQNNNNKIMKAENLNAETDH